MPPKEFSIVLQYPNEGKFYLPRDTLRGKVMVALGKHDGYKVLRIVILGRAKTSWLEKENGPIEIVEAVEDYINFVAELKLEKSTAIERVEYGFEYELSEGLPSSFRGDYGDVTYVVKATLKGVVEKDPVVRTRQEFLVSDHLNLNEIPEALEPVEVSKQQELLFESGKLSLEVKLDKQGVVAGERVFINALFNNESQEEVYVNAGLVQETTFYSQHKKIFTAKILANQQGPSVGPLQTTEWIGEVLEIPASPVPFPFLQNCHIIAARYYLTVEMEIPLPNINLEAKLPLILGTKVLKNKEIVKDADDGSNVTEVAEPRANQPTYQRGGARRLRANRPATTCLVFRPDRLKLKLPEPKPETWTSKSNPGTVKEPNPPNDPPVSSSPKTITSSPPNTNDSKKPKWPQPYIRRRPAPPPKPARLQATELTTLPLFEAEQNKVHSSCGRMRENADHSDSEVLPYPTSTSENSPVPDFSFNVSIDGEKRQSLGWKVTRNTLTLKRGESGLRD